MTRLRIFINLISMSVKYPLNFLTHNLKIQLKILPANLNSFTVIKIFFTFV